jgi:hypothetical protein
VRFPPRAALLLPLALAVGCAWFGGGDDEAARRAQAREAPPVLPDALAAAVRRDFADLRPPSRRDQVGSGDFDGDGRADFALILGGSGGWTLAVYFRDERRGFRLTWPEARERRESDDSNPAKAQSVRVLRAGSPYSFTRLEAGRGYEGKITYAYRFERDAVLHGAAEQGETILYWTDGRFEALGFGE